jgi:hypothetical protein
VTALFIGVVSHAGSRFAVSQGPDGLAARLVEPMGRHGIDVTVLVNTDDAYDAATLPITDAVVQASLTEQLHLDRRWAAYLGGGRGPRWWANHSLRWLRRAEQAVRRPGPRMVERLLNIELSHLAVLRAGAASGADWILVLEDDAASTDIDDCADGLRGLMSCGPRQPAYVNVSQSFTPRELGIEHLLSPVPGVPWDGTVTRQVLAASRPVTNTVCAILYRSGFVDDLIAAMDALPMEPVVPIDWKLNLALMRLSSEGRLGAGDCWQVEPGPIDQLSMRSEASA